MNQAQEYLEAHDLQTRDTADVLEEFGDELAGMTGKCIDVGCGPGDLTRKLLMPRLPVDARVVGGDISKKMIEFAKDHQRDEKRLSFIEFDVEAEKIPEELVGAYDHAVSFYCLHWCQDIRKAFDNIYEMLRPGGRALILFMARNSGFDSYVKMSEIPQYMPYMKDATRYVPYFQHAKNPRATLKKIIEEAGFEVQHCSYREKTFIYKSLEVLDKHVQAVNPFVHRMPEAMREKFNKDLLREIMSEKISIASKSNGSKVEEKVLDRYYLLIAYFKKPNEQK